MLLPGGSFLQNRRAFTQQSRCHLHRAKMLTDVLVLTAVLQALIADESNSTLEGLIDYQAELYATPLTQGANALPERMS